MRLGLRGDRRASASTRMVASGGPTHTRLGRSLSIVLAIVVLLSGSILASAPATSASAVTYKKRSLATLISEPVQTTVINGEVFKYAWYHYGPGANVIKRNESSCRRMELKIGVKNNSWYAKLQVVREGLETKAIVAPAGEVTTASFRLKVGKYVRVRLVEADVTTRDVYINGSAMCSTRTGKL